MSTVVVRFAPPPTRARRTLWPATLVGSYRLIRP
jgi:hypothetical protein